MRYKNNELYELEARINRAEREAMRLELQIFESLVQVYRKHS
jgi:DNA mismatch repair ATPase MutS